MDTLTENSISPSLQNQALQCNRIACLFNRLSRSKFRSRFKLTNADISYIHRKGIPAITNHAYDFIRLRLAPPKAKIPNDGKQTPYRGHPVFIAQHATGSCCRSCLYRWHRIPPQQRLSDAQIDYIVAVIMHWINLQIWQNPLHCSCHHNNDDTPLFRKINTNSDYSEDLQ